MLEKLLNFSMFFIIWFLFIISAVSLKNKKIIGALPSFAALCFVAL